MNEEIDFEEGIVETTDEIMSEHVSDRLVEDDRPSIFDPEWNNYVMSHFKDDELIDGNPICAGLRRVSELLLGDVVESGPTQVFAPQNGEKPDRATVVYKVVFNWMNSGEYRTFSECADVWHGNTDDLFCAHPVATASTRAEGRALRKALKIRALAAEELARKDIVEIVKQTTSSIPTDGDWNPDDKISGQQIAFIDNKCKQLDINVIEFINSGDSFYNDATDIKKNVATRMIRELNKYQTKETSVPEELMGYIKNWRN
tara:strand:+ start:2695 stop:3471 length:777 start_codon:yes stop_codon:yes gene_type:complete